jgi:hypothetical protein
MLNPNWAALPGTKFEADPGPLQVAQAFLPYALQDAKAKAASKAAEVAQKKAEAEKILGREVKPVAEWDVPAYQGYVKDYRKTAQDLFRMRDANPGNPAFDPMNPTSEAYLKLKEAEDALTQFQDVSSKNQEGFLKYMAGYDPTKDSPDDLKEALRYWQAPAGEHMAGKVAQPTLLGVFDENKYHTDLAKGLGLDTEKAYAYTDENGIRHEGVTNVLSEDRLGAAAMSAAENPQDRYSIAINRQIGKMADADRKALEKLASAEGISPAAYLARDKAKQYARKEKTASIEGSMADAYGSGYKTREMEAKRPVDFMEGLYTGNMAVFDALEKPAIETSPTFGIPAVGKPIKMYSSGALMDYVSDQTKVKVGDKVYDVNYRIEEIQVEPNGDYTFIERPDLVELEPDSKLEIKNKAPEKRKTVSKEQAPTYLWRKFPQFNKNVSEAEMTKYLESKGGTYEKTGKVRFNAAGTNDLYDVTESETLTGDLYGN